jgi:hypothetical protein
MRSTGYCTITQRPLQLLAGPLILDTKNAVALDTKNAGGRRAVAKLPAVSSQLDRGCGLGKRSEGDSEGALSLGVLVEIVLT